MRTVFDLSDPTVDRYSLLNSIVVPRPIAWISTLSADGAGNLAPHSFFTVACANPAMIAFSSVGRKDTLRNIEATGEFVVSMTPEWMLAHVNNSSAKFEHGTDEASELGIAMEPSEIVAPPRVAESPTSLECRLHSSTELGDSTLVIGEVVAITVADEVLIDGRPSFAALRPLSRLGGNEWGKPPETFELQRPAKPEGIVD